MSYAPLGSVGIFQTSVGSKAYAKRRMEVTDSGLYIPLLMAADYSFNAA